MKFRITSAFQLSQPWLQKSLLGITLFLALLVLPLYAFKVDQKKDYTDFQVYYHAAERMKNQQWDQVYQLQDGASPFRYAPIWLPLFRPLAELPQDQAKLLWYFLQYFAFGFGFYWIYRSIRQVTKRGSSDLTAVSVTCLSLLFILRFCLDTFTIGQVSSFMFLGFAMALYAWMNRRPVLASAGLLVPTLLKIGPGFLYGAYLASRKKERMRGLRGTLLLVTGLGIFSSAWLWTRSTPLDGATSVLKKLWLGWMEIVAMDSSYYDASHYGSQSLKSVLLRGVRSGWLLPTQVELIYLALTAVVCTGIVSFWILRKPRSYYGRGLFFSLGLFAYFWLMPETFKYSLTPLAIPAAFLFAAPRPSWLTRLALALGILTLSLAGKDIVGDPLFFGSQIRSIPFIATLLLAAAVFRLAWAHSIPSSFSRGLSKLLSAGRRIQKPWETLPLPHSERPLDVSLLVPIPLQAGLPLHPDLIRKVILESHHLLNSRDPARFEILLIPFGNRISSFHPVFQEIRKLTAEFEEVRLTQSFELEGRGSALRAGFLESRGKKILLSQIEQPCGIQFFQQALPLLDSGYDLVRANRRHSESHFRIPVRVLHLAYGRHRLGLMFNRFMRMFLPIQTTDTHSGTFALSWRLAVNAFAVQNSPDILFDLELNLISTARGYREKDLPVTLSLAEEKSHSRVIIESLGILFGIWALAWRYRRGNYHSIPQPQGITADDWGLSPGVNQGILQLARLGIVRRVSVMANGAYLEDGLRELSSLPGVELGLHFNLTYGESCQKRTTPQAALLSSSPKAFLAKWMNPFGNRHAQREEVRAELRSQLEKLKAVGVRVRYLDGHHHIHLVPGLVGALADLLKTAGVTQIRLPDDRTLWASTRAPIAWLTFLARPQFKKYGLSSLPCIYPHPRDFRDPGKLRAKLAKCPNAEVIVHPAETDDFKSLAIRDSYTAGRVMEFRVLRMLRPEL